jgi:hypothetical protein
MRLIVQNDTSVGLYSHRAQSFLHRVHRVQSLSDLERLNTIHYTGNHKVVQKLACCLLSPTLELDEESIIHSRFLERRMQCFQAEIVKKFE